MGSRYLQESFGLKRRFCLGLALTLLPLLVAVAIGYWAIQDLSAAADRLVAEATEEIAPVTELRRQVHDLADAMRVTVGRSAMPLAPAVLNAVDQQFGALLQVDFAAPGERDALKQTAAEWHRLRTLLRQDPDADVLERGKLLIQLERIEGHLEHIHQLALAEMSLLQKQVRTSRRHTGVFLLAVVALALTLSVVTGLTLARSVLVPLQALRRGVLRLGSGDLSARVTELGQDELAELARCFNEMATRLETSHRELAELSACDYLTGLYNVREFYRLFHEELRRSERYGHHFTLVLLDIDRFKEVNDTYGHQTGDYLLQEVARRLTTRVRVNDHVARIGGDEFCIILPETGQEEARDLAERIRMDMQDRAVAVPQHPEDALRMTVSIGMATFPVDARDAETLFTRADSALYRAKDGGRNRLEVAVKENGERCRHVSRLETSEGGRP